MPSFESQFYVTIIGGTIITLLLVAFLFAFFAFFQRRQAKHRQEKTALKAQYEQEILQSQLEVQNQTLQNLGRELHDNIGQLLTVAKINLGMVEANLEEKNITEATENNQQVHLLVNQIISEVRSLSKSLDGNFVQEFGLQESTTHELQRIKKTKKFETELIVEGEPYKLDFQREIILYRVVQEVLNNAMKHAKATEIVAVFAYGPTFFELIISDNGIGFDLDRTLNQKEIEKSGVGLRSIQKRVSLIGGECKIESKPNKGVTYTIRIPR